MRCIYFDGETCNAHPAVTRLAYKPNEEERNKICDTRDFQTCPRLHAFIDYMKAISKPSP
jgi:hypothetical protein